MTHQFLVLDSEDTTGENIFVMESTDGQTALREVLQIIREDEGTEPNPFRVQILGGVGEPFLTDEVETIH